jgi:hypothetical protein
MSEKLVSNGLHKPVERKPADVITVPLAVEQASALARVRREARLIILTKWSIEKQLNAALGLLSTAETDQLKVDIQAVRDASNTAETAIQGVSAANSKALKANERAAINARASVTWPVL